MSVLLQRLINKIDARPVADGFSYSEEVRPLEGWGKEPLVGNDNTVLPQALTEIVYSYTWKWTLTENEVECTLRASEPMSQSKNVLVWVPTHNVILRYGGKEFPLPADPGDHQGLHPVEFKSDARRVVAGISSLLKATYRLSTPAA